MQLALLHEADTFQDRLRRNQAQTQRLRTKYAAKRQDQQRQREQQQREQQHQRDVASRKTPRTGRRTQGPSDGPARALRPAHTESKRSDHRHDSGPGYRAVVLTPSGAIWVGAMRRARI